MKKLAILGGGRGGQLIAETINNDIYGERYEIEFYDDYSEMGIRDVPDDCYIIISIGLRMDIRRKWFGMFDCNRFINSNRSEYMVNMGVGNVIFPNAHFDLFHKIGDNNVISSGTIINHHCKVGSGNLFGPGCLLSGSVEIGDNCTFGSGVIIEPNVRIGNNTSVASGTVITKDVLENVRILARRNMQHSSVFQGERMVKAKRL